MASSQGASQLFQVLYLGSTWVDRHCSQTIMPWIAEELKLRTEQKIFTWLAPGENGVSYVANTGVELFHHAYSTILCCATGVDGITFAYIIRDKDGSRYTCHVFQCLTPEEAKQLMKKLRTSARGDSEATPTTANLPPPTSYVVHYVGSVGVRSSTHSSDLLDSLLEKHGTRRRRKLSRRGILPQLMRTQTQHEESRQQESIHDSAREDVTTSVLSRVKGEEGEGGILGNGGEGRIYGVGEGGRVEGEGGQVEGEGGQVEGGRVEGEGERVQGEGGRVEGGRVEGEGGRVQGEGGIEVRESRSQDSSVAEGGRGMRREDSCDVSIRLTRATPEKLFRDEGEIEGQGEEETEGGEEGERAVEKEEVEGGETEVEKLLTLLPDGGAEFVYNSDNDDDSHTTGSSTSCNTPDPTGRVGDLTPTNGVTPAYSDPKLFDGHQRLLVQEREERPASCPPPPVDHTKNIGDNPEREKEDGPGFQATSELNNEGGTPPYEVEGGARPVDGLPHTLQNGAMEEVDSSFDTLPELTSLRDTPQFKALGRPGSGEGGGGGGEGGEEVRLVIAPNMVQVVSADGSKVILRRTIRSIACCTQGEKRAEFVGFVCREGQSKQSHICHIFRAASQAMATAVMDSFKSSFVEALNSSPTAMCDSCPLKQLHLLCQSLEGVSTPVAQSRIQECLSQLSEADYNCIMSEYKSSEHADHEFTQLVVLVSLIREHLQKKQEEHIHPITTTSSSDGSLLQTKNHQPVKPVRLSKLERAKLALASSFDNLRKGSAGKTTEKRSRQFGKSLTTDDAAVPVSSLLATEDRRASLDPKLLAEKRGKMVLERSSSAKVPAVLMEGGGDSSGGEEMGGRVGGRTRTGSWLQRFRGSKPAASSSQDEESDGEMSTQQQRKRTTSEGREEERREPSPVGSSSPKEIRPAQKLERFESKEDLPATPPTTSPLEKSHPPAPPPTLHPAKFRTPTHVPARRKPEVRVRRAHTRAAFSLPPNDGTSQAYSKYRREHKRSESMSWRHEIFESVTPVKERNTDFQDWEIIEPASFDQLGRSATSGPSSQGRVGGRGGGEGREEGRGSPRSVSSRERWRRAIEQQIMLQRMEKENQSLMKANTEADIKRLKLCYQDPSINVDCVNRKWAELLSRPHPPNESELSSAVVEGVTPGRRGEVWSFLIQQYQERHPSHPLTPSHPHTLTQLCQMSTDSENAIHMDLGRTFPSHPYFRLVGVGGGQRALANILHGYAVWDVETGYCQGLSFIAGMILMHTKDEESAYQLLCQMMFVYSYRDVYSRDLSVLQIRLYQLSRLLHDILPTLHSHLGIHEITPFYYAAPWFLTLFSSQYPIAFVARVMDLFFLDGPDIVFKVAVALLRYYESHILRCTTMESISEFLKENMPQLVLNHMTTILEDAHRMDLESKLQNFETEYFVLEELTTSFSVESDAQDLRSLNESYRSHNKELIEHLALCRGMIGNLQSDVASLQETVREQQKMIKRLEVAQCLPTALSSPETRSPPLETKSLPLTTKITPLETNSLPLLTGLQLESNSPPLQANSLQLETNSPPLQANSLQLETNSPPLQANSLQLETNSLSLETNSLPPQPGPESDNEESSELPLPTPVDNSTPPTSTTLPIQMDQPSQDH